METKELNLLEILKGCEGETFYSPFYGAMKLSEMENKLLYFTTKHDAYICLFSNGHYQYAVDGDCGVYPSRALYEQYPLDPVAAWMKWQEEQDDLLCDVSIDSIDKGWAYRAIFRTASDRDKCIEEIQVIIEKYSEK